MYQNDEAIIDKNGQEWVIMGKDGQKEWTSNERGR
jgi:hypothetical protein